MRLLAYLVWGSLLVTFVGFLLLESRGMVDTGDGAVIESLVSVLTAVFMFLLALPILRKLLAISRLVTMFVLFAWGWLLLEVLDLQDIAWAQSLLNDAPLEPISELVELMELMELLATF